MKIILLLLILSTHTFAKFKFKFVEYPNDHVCKHLSSFGVKKDLKFCDEDFLNKTHNRMSYLVKEIEKTNQRLKWFTDFNCKYVKDFKDAKRYFGSRGRCSTNSYLKRNGHKSVQKCCEVDINNLKEKSQKKLVRLDNEFRDLKFDLMQGTTKFLNNPEKLEKICSDIHCSMKAEKQFTEENLSFTTQELYLSNFLRTLYNITFDSSKTESLTSFDFEKFKDVKLKKLVTNFCSSVGRSESYANPVSCAEKVFEIHQELESSEVFKEISEFYTLDTNSPLKRFTLEDSLNNCNVKLDDRVLITKFLFKQTYTKLASLENSPEIKKYRKSFLQKLFSGKLKNKEVCEREVVELKKVFGKIDGYGYVSIYNYQGFEKDLKSFIDACDRAPVEFLKDNSTIYKPFLSSGNEQCKELESTLTRVEEVFITGLSSKPESQENLSDFRKTQEQIKSYCFINDVLNDYIKSDKYDKELLGKMRATCKDLEVLNISFESKLKILNPINKGRSDLVKDVDAINKGLGPMGLPIFYKRVKEMCDRI